ncbi:MAG TPA: hydantoinase/oxoprolinase N-terminal domain-containing protein [Methylomirabilota bacterium]|nr:hydantoinase/oxoprolinase N-terminal domain-containing protein [Methylomirabilota bacterium]
MTGTVLLRSGRAVVGVDIGGTFTDLVLLSNGARPPALRKVLTTPGDPADAVIQGIHDLVATEGLRPSRLALLIHGTTLATNAIIERKGARIPGNLSGTLVEIFENEKPMLVERERAEGTPGPGRYRGSAGLHFSVRSVGGGYGDVGRRDREPPRSTVPRA